MDKANEAEPATEEPAAEEPSASTPAAAAEPVHDLLWIGALVLLIGATFLLSVSSVAVSVVGGLLGVAGLVAAVALALRARTVGSTSIFMPVMVGVVAAVMVVAQLLRWLS